MTSHPTEKMGCLGAPKTACGYNSYALQVLLIKATRLVFGAFFSLVCTGRSQTQAAGIEYFLQTI